MYACDCGLAMSVEIGCRQHHSFPTELDTAGLAEQNASESESTAIGMQVGPAGCALGALNETNLIRLDSPRLGKGRLAA